MKGKYKEKLAALLAFNQVLVLSIPLFVFKPSLKTENKLPQVKADFDENQSLFLDKNSEQERQKMNSSASSLPSNSPPLLIHNPTPSPIFISNSVSFAPTPTPNLESQVSLLSSPKELRNETYCVQLGEYFSDPVEETAFFSGNIFLEIEVELYTAESLEGFDNPMFKVWVDEQPVYGLTSSEIIQEIQSNKSGESFATRIYFNLTYFSDHPTAIKFWSGDSLDSKFPSWARLTGLNLFSFPLKKADQLKIETQPISNLKIDSTQFGGAFLTTLEFISPQTDDPNLDRVLAYEFRLSEQPLNKDSWLDGVLLTTVKPTEFTPAKSDQFEFVLLGIPFNIISPLEKHFLNIRSVDSWGKPSSWITRRELLLEFRE